MAGHQNDLRLRLLFSEFAQHIVTFKIVIAAQLHIAEYERPRIITAQQIHGKEIAVVNVAISADKCFANCDGIIADQPDACLGIYVADCCAIYLVDPVRRAIGLIHSGKKGTELGVVPNAIKTMTAQFGSRPADLVIQLSPCIRPPHYEIDFAADIVRQCRDLGVKSVHDSGVCTACDLTRYYSYRAEKGRTGRMLAFLTLA